MAQSQATRTIIDTHRHIFGPKLRQKFVENIGFDDSKPLPQANAGEMFFYRESVGHGPSLPRGEPPWDALG
jgi:hypothetical protein